MPVSEPWSVLRALRAAPPGRAATEVPRQTVFAAALEQAEQFLAAASSVGYATKPVQLFYALSQASRALAAVCADEPWEIRGHGASVNASADVATTTVKIAESPAGALGLVARASGSELWVGPANLGVLWASLPELPVNPQLTGSAVRALEIARYEYFDYSHLAARFGGTVQFYTSVAPVPVSGFAWRAGLRVPDAPSDPGELHALVERLLAPYPKAAGWSIAPALAMTNTYAPGPDPDPIMLQWVYEDEDGQRVWVAPELLTVQYGDSLYLRPGMGPSRAVPSSLVTWWALLLALSSLARYQPVAWRRALDIDHSPIAHTLERGLEIAEQRIPELILDAIGARTPETGRIPQVSASHPGD